MCMVPVAKAPDPYKEIKVASDSHIGIPSQVRTQKLRLSMHSGRTVLNEFMQ